MTVRETVTFFKANLREIWQIYQNQREDKIKWKTQALFILHDTFVAAKMTNKPISHLSLHQTPTK